MLVEFRPELAIVDFFAKPAFKQLKLELAIIAIKKLEAVDIVLARLKVEPFVKA